MAFGKTLTKEQALQKLKHYCAYQERCHKEVRDKLFALGAWRKDHDEIIATLIEEKYLDEERFAIAYAGGKFRMKNWGRTRIRYALQQKQVSEYSIKKALAQFDKEEYEAKARELANEKFSVYKSEQYLVRKKKTIDFLLYRGFEPELANSLLNELTGGTY